VVSHPNSESVSYEIGKEASQTCQANFLVARSLKIACMLAAMMIITLWSYNYTFLGKVVAMDLSDPLQQVLGQL
jgi:hypothetical protein